MQNLPRTLVQLAPGDAAPSLEAGQEQTTSYSLLRGPGVYLVVRAGSVISDCASQPEGGPVIDASGEIIDPGLADLYSRVDATILRPEATADDIQEFALAAKQKSCRNVCLYPAHMQYVLDVWPSPATVVSFPHGLDTTKMKVKEIKQAIREGAGEIDMVANRTLIEAGEWQQTEEELELCLQASEGAMLKVILETGELALENVFDASRLCAKIGIPCIKTSTGMASVGARAEDVKTMRLAAPSIKIKASGGIRSRESAAALHRAGADVFGLSDLDALGTV